MSLKKMNVESTVQKICNCLDALLTDTRSETETEITASNEKEALCHELRRKVHITLEKIENYPEIKGIVIKFVQTCYGKKCSCDHLTFLQMSLVLLRLLQKALSQEEADSCSSKSHGGCKMFMPRGLLSISQQKVLKKCFQFIVGLGILPNLLRGIGVPLNRRLQHSNVFEIFSSDSTCYQKHVQLVLCLETLLDCLECDAMQSILFSYHGTDLFATLLQLCHAPIKKIEKSQMPPLKTPMSEKIEFRSVLAAIRDNSQHSESEIVALMLIHRNHFTRRLEKFLNQISPSLLIWELILFQGSPSRSDISDMTLPRCPVWIRKICNQMLTDLLMQNNGIVSLVQAVLDKVFDMDIESGKVDTKRIEAVASLITSNCVRHVSLENYMLRLSKQVFQLLHLKGSPMDSLLKYIASCVVLQFYTLDRLLGENCFFKRILDPLWKCVLDYDNSSTQIIVTEKEMFMCIEELYQIFVSCSTPLRRECIEILFPFFHCLSMLYFFLVKGTSFLKSKLKELLLCILSSASNEEALALLRVVTIPNSKHPKVHHCTLSFTNGDEGGIVAVPKKKKADVSEEISCYHDLLDLISDLQNKELNSAFILLIMKEYCSFHLEVKESPFNACNIRVRLAFSALLQELSEWNADIGEALISNIQEVMDLLMTLLESICNYQTDAPFYEETAMVVLMILSSLLTSENHELTADDWTCIKRCLPSLHKLQKCDIDSDLKDMLLSVLIHIATHGADGIQDSKEVRDLLRNCAELEACISTNEESDEDDSSTESNSFRDTFFRTEKLCEAYEEASRVVPPDSPSAREEKEDDISDYFSTMSTDSELQESSKGGSKKLPDFETAFSDANNEDIPVRGHGLIELGKLLKVRDQKALSRKDQLFEIFMKNLDDEDSYVYLAAINGLAYLGEVDRDMILLEILQVYTNPEEKSDIKLKMGEVLIKITRELGEQLIYKYRDQLLHTFLIGSKHADPQIRSSSLSNLGETCLLLKCNIGSHWLQEILVCVLSYLKTDKDLEVRRCTVMVIALLLRGLGKDIFRVLSNDLNTLYSQLRLIFNTEEDPVIRNHSQIALHEITLIMKEILFTPPTEQFTKEIRILS